MICNANSMITPLFSRNLFHSISRMATIYTLNYFFTLYKNILHYSAIFYKGFT